ncbi:hypothetical protein [Undibacterium sp. TJN19]|uniref:hypothetical protein n=1 Tax=Undibacterium sp. TJN19 TaxID=3413055 RepID=UPI003BF349C8
MPLKSSGLFDFSGLSITGHSIETRFGGRDRTTPDHGISLTIWEESFNDIAQASSHA